MGIRGLYRFISDNKCYEERDIVKVAQNKGNIEILVDAHFFVSYISELIRNDCPKMPIGEYSILSYIFGDIHVTFKEAGITLVWIVDGPKIRNNNGKSQYNSNKDLPWRKNDSTNSKPNWKFNSKSRQGTLNHGYSQSQIKIWKERDAGDLGLNKKIFNACQTRENIKNYDGSSINDIEICLDQLKDTDAEIINLLSGGNVIDSIASMYKERGSYAIITKNTDYLLFQNCEIILTGLLDLLPMKLENKYLKRNLFKRLGSWNVKISNSNHICRALKLKSHDELILVGLLRSRDLAECQYKRLLEVIGLNGEKYIDLQSTVKFIADESINIENLKSNSLIKKYMLENEEFEMSIDRHIRLFIRREIPMSGVVYRDGYFDDDLTDYLAKKLSLGLMNRHCYCIHNGFFFQRVCVEDLEPDYQSIMDTLSIIRSKIYPYLLKRRLTKVLEWSCKNKRFVEVEVIHSDIKTNKLKGQPDGLEIFDKIWSQHESAALNYLESFETEKALILYVLRYVHTITDNKTLCLSVNEFEALFVTVFYQYSTWKSFEEKTKIVKDSFLRMKIFPSPRCVTISTWFINTYYTAKYICGGALNICDLIPSPAAVMNGSSWFTIYETIAGDQSRVEYLSSRDISTIMEVRREIMETFHKEYMAVSRL